MNILIVDDSKCARYSVIKSIQHLKIDVISVDSGHKAIEAFKTMPIGLVIMDAEMPGMNGFEATQKIRELSGNKWIPVIFLSAHSDDSFIQRALDSGADVYLYKPVNPVVLNSHIKAMTRIVAMQSKLDELNQELSKTIEELKVHANQDGLTQINNRRVFNERLELEFCRTLRYQKPLSLLLCDIDYFKPFNDNYGHVAGDACLKKVAHIIKNKFKRTTDLVARYGGEEFVILMPDTPCKQAKRLAKQLHKTLSKSAIPHEFSKVANHLTLSIGVATTEGEIYTPEDFIHKADIALYTAKSKGRNQVYSPYC